jgi:hypothetical protein
MKEREGKDSFEYFIGLHRDCLQREPIRWISTVEGRNALLGAGSHENNTDDLSAHLCVKE